MKKLLFLSTILLLTIQFSSFAQYDQERVMYLDKVNRYGKMQTIGFIMAGAGVAITTAGGYLLASIDEEDESDANFARAFFGVGGVLFGIPLIGGGTTLGIIGTVKKEKYTNALKGLSLDLKFNKVHRGIAVRYTF
jgi:hypothetical protein